MKNEKYFIERFHNQEKISHEMALKRQGQLKKIYREAKRELENDLALFIERYSRDNELSSADLKKMLNTKEIAEFRYSIKRYVEEIEKLGDSKEARELKKELDVLSGRTRISRKEDLLNSINLQLGKTAIKAQKIIGGHLKNVVEFVYDDTKDILKGNTLAKLDPKLIEKIVNQKWNDKNYSQRVWHNRKGLSTKIMKNITTGFIQGHDFEKMSSKLAYNMNVGFYEARRIIETETTGALENAKSEIFKEMGVKKYKFIATIDDRTSSICRSLNGKIFEEKDRQTGINSPFCHPFCRSVTIPVIEKKEKNIDNSSENGIIKEEKEVVKDKIYDNFKNNEIDKFFESQENYKKWTLNLSDEEKDSILQYTMSSYNQINAYMRHGDNYENVLGWKMSEKELTEIKKISDNLMKSTSNYTVEKSFKTYRRTEISSLDKNFSNLKVGEKTIIDKGFMSTTLDKKIIEDFGNDGIGSSYEFEITVKKGSKSGAYISKQSDWAEEREFLFKPNTEFKVISVKEIKTGEYVVELECE